ncbi:MAG: hypothetical protein V1855_03310 [bacterium]
MENQEKNQGGSSVAWYKLADLITRREREKALSVYRLLSHSLEDRAYALQLEGDILHSLDDNGACEKYKQAAYLYKKEKRWIDAIAVCNHLLTMNPENTELLATRLSLYILTDWKDRFFDDLKKIFEKNVHKELTGDQVLGVIKGVISIVQDEQLDHGLNWLHEGIKKHQHCVPALLQEQLQEVLG